MVGWLTHWAIIVLLLLVLWHSHLVMFSVEKVGVKLGIDQKEFTIRSLVGRMFGGAPKAASAPEGLVAPAQLNPRVSQNEDLGALMSHAQRMEMRFAADDAAARRRRILMMKASGSSAVA